jgi:hypothetical protein
MGSDPQEDQQIYRLQGIISAQEAALKHWRREFDVEHALRLASEGMEDRVAAWVRLRVGEQSMRRKERAMRLFEEACELAQAEGITWNMAVAQVHEVFHCQPGHADLEGAAVAFTLLGWCAAAGLKFLEIAAAEIARNERRPTEEVEASNARKLVAQVISEGE